MCWDLLLPLWLVLVVVVVVVLASPGMMMVGGRRHISPGGGGGGGGEFRSLTRVTTIPPLQLCCRRRDWFVSLLEKQPLRPFGVICGWFWGAPHHLKTAPRSLSLSPYPPFPTNEYVSWMAVEMRWLSSG